MKNPILRVLAIKSFLFLWLSEVFTQVAMNMLNFVLIVVAFTLANSNTAVSGIVLSFVIPSILCGLLAGVYVDRWNKKSVLFLTNILRGILLLGIILFHTNLFMLYLLSLLISLVNQFFIPAEIPIIPLVVEKELLLPANALFGMGVYGSILVGYALSGPFLSLFGQQGVFGVLSLLFFVAAVFISFVTLRKSEEKNSTTNKNDSFSLSLRDEIKTVFSLITQTKRIYQSLFLLTLIQVIILTLAVIGPGYARQILGIEVSDFPLLFATPAALGMVAGGVVTAYFFQNHPKQRIVILGLFVCAISTLILPYGSKVTSRAIVSTINAFLPHAFSITISHIMVLLAFFLGVGNALVFVPANTVLQEATSDELRGKVYGMLNTIVGVFSFFPILIVGELADVFGVAKVLTWIGSLLFLIALLQTVMRIKKK